MMDLVERAQAGEADAFGRLYDQYSDTVYRYIYYRVGGKATAEDLTSETFLRALRRISTFTWQGRDFGAWLVTIARNLVADHFKSSRFRLEVTTGEMLDANEVERSPEDSVLESLSNAALLQAVRRLNPQQQECVTLRFLQGLSVAETARVMGKNEGRDQNLAVPRRPHARPAPAGRRPLNTLCDTPFTHWSDHLSCVTHVPRHSLCRLQAPCRHSMSADTHSFVWKRSRCATFRTPRGVDRHDERRCRQ